MNNRIFVYGTLKQGFHAFERMLKPYAYAIHEARMLGRMYDTGHGFPAVVDLRPGEPESWVYGQMMEVRGVFTVLDMLDRYEGVESGLYFREEREVLVCIGGREEKRLAWVYLMNRMKVERETVWRRVACGRWG